MSINIIYNQKKVLINLEKRKKQNIFILYYNKFNYIIFVFLEENHKLIYKIGNKFSLNSNFLFLFKSNLLNHFQCLHQLVLVKLIVLK